MSRRIKMADGDKEARRLAKHYGMTTAGKNDGRMLALAFSIRSKDSLLGISGHIEERNEDAVEGRIADRPDPSRPFAAYLREYEAILPWKGLTQAEHRAFSTCAEAHIWLELVSRAKNPRDYYAASFTKRGDLSAPCKNCEQWVFRTFGQVFTPSLHYANHPKQKP